MVSKIRSDDADDTGGQDVRELRERFSDGGQAPVVEEATLTDEEIEAELLQMVDDGELCCGWIPERQEFGFWAVDTCTSGTCAPDPEPCGQAAPVVKPVHRRVATSRVLRRTLVTLVFVFATPLVGVAMAQNQQSAKELTDYQEAPPKPSRGQWQDPESSYESPDRHTGIARIPDLAEILYR